AFGHLPHRRRGPAEPFRPRRSVFRRNLADGGIEDLMHGCFAELFRQGLQERNQHPPLDLAALQMADGNFILVGHDRPLLLSMVDMSCRERCCRSNQLFWRLDLDFLSHEDASDEPSRSASAMSYGLPPLNALRAFEASARHLSFKRAADELSVTAGAVSQQVK